MLLQIILVLMKTKLAARKYYKDIESSHMTGDIWMNLPSLGVLKQQLCSGLVITPSCDLANAKVETITYLPIISIDSWFTSRAFYYEARNQFINISKEKIPLAEDILLKNKVPSHSDIGFIEEMLRDIKESNKTDKTIKARIVDGIDILRTVITYNDFVCDKVKLGNFLGEKLLNNVLIKIIRNSYSNDIHFLPKDQEPHEWSAVPSHSVVLFRYPITVPIEILDLANDHSCLEWKREILNLKNMYPIVTQFIDNKPLKAISLENAFLSDLLTRFVGLYVRIGSPDFTNETVHEILKELK